MLAGASFGNVRASAALYEPLRRLPQITRMSRFPSAMFPPDQHAAPRIDHGTREISRGRSYSEVRHARPCAGHPRLVALQASKAWMAGTRPGHDGGGVNPRVHAGR